MKTPAPKKPDPVPLQPRRERGPMSDLSREFVDMERRAQEAEAARTALATPPAAPPPAKPRA